MDFSWSAIWVIWHIPKAREEYVSPLYVYRTMGVICTSPLPTTMNAFTCNIWQNTYEPIFPKTREYPCVGYVICTQSKYIRTYDFKIFQVEVTSVTSVQRSERNVTETVALLFQRLDYTRLKGKNQLDFEPFYSVQFKLRSPPRLHVTRVRTCQGGS